MTNHYDYIVVGAGSSGAALAARLSEDRDCSVLLIEAGSRNGHPFQLMPLAFMKLAFRSAGTWQYLSEPEPELKGRRLPTPRGKVLGGTSSINAMIAIRGNRRDYDRWAEQGCDGWSYAEVLPYFKRLENSWRGAGPFHGDSGPVQISLMEGSDMLFEPLAEAARAVGIPLSEDANGETQEGVSRMEATIGGGKRSSSARAYLTPAFGRSNLTIETDALATRVLVDKARAVGIEYRQHGTVKKATSSGEIILASGAYNSPQLLMLSGIGPADELAAAGVKPIHDLPGVGRNLAEHPNILNEHELTGLEGMTRYLRLDRAMYSVARWTMTHTGPFALNGSAANIFLRSEAGLDRPDMQLVSLPISNNANLWIPGIQRRPTFRLSMRVGTLHAESRGWVKLRSNSPSDAPRILFNMFSEPHDLEMMVRALKISRDIYAQSPLRELIAQESSPGVGVRTDRELADFIRETVQHRSHPVGTCRMGVDEQAVVDPQLRVRGLDGLRIADASIMPDLPSGNTNLPCIMIGEKAADLIRGRRIEAPHPAV